MEIEVGEYVKTKNGYIIKIDEETIIFNMGYEEQYVDMESTIYGLPYEEEIVKHSFNIINLIEVGDYVNGKYVYSVGTAIGNLPIINHTDGTFTTSNMIKTIVTHEQFSSIEYKVESEDK